MLVKIIDGTPLADLTPGSEKRIEVCCDLCGKITTTNYHNYAISQKKRSLQGKTYCRACVCKLSAAARKGKPAHNKGKKLPPNKKGENHASWRGGRYISNDGYVMIHVGGEKGKNNWNQYKKEHFIIAEQMLGRPLLKDEVVHHIDGDKQNNDPLNLWVTNHSGHRLSHQSLQEVGYSLIRQGVIVFENGRYRLTGE